MNKLLVTLKKGQIAEMWEAAKEIIRRQDHEIIPEMLVMLDSKLEAERRSAAAWIVGELRSPDATKPLIRLLGDRSEPAMLREQAAESLGYLAASDARKVVLENLNDSDLDIVFSCLFALRTVGTPRDLKRLADFTGAPLLTNSYGASLAREAQEAMQQIRYRYQSKR